LKVQLNDMVKKSKIDIFLIGILVGIIIFTRIIFMENYLEELIYIDSYKYISSAIFLEPSDPFQGSFVGFISLIYPSSCRIFEPYPTPHAKSKTVLSFTNLLTNSYLAVCSLYETDSGR